MTEYVKCIRAGHATVILGEIYKVIKNDGATLLVAGKMKTEYGFDQDWVSCSLFEAANPSPIRIKTTLKPVTEVTIVKGNYFTCDVRPIKGNKRVYIYLAGEKTPEELRNIGNMFLEIANALKPL